MPESVSEVVTGEEELIVTVGELKVNVGAKPVVLVEMAENATVPVKLLVGVAVIVTAGIVPPAATVRLKLLPEAVTPAALGVRPKSGHVVLVTWTSTGWAVVEPFAVRAGPIEPW
jgi:hypothetical protein